MSTVFTLEALFARQGDCLLLHYGPWDRPRRILIDGGPAGVYKKFLAPRLGQMREEFELEEDESLPFEMVMVSHIDGDHITGILELFEAIVEARDTHQPAPYALGTLWHNSFDDLLGNAEVQVLSRLAATAASKDPAGLPLPRMSRESKAVVASTEQGRDLRNLARRLNVAVNDPFGGLLIAPASQVVALDPDLTLTLVGPPKDEVKEFQEAWDKDLKTILEEEDESAHPTAFEDDSPFNLASICVLAELNGKTMLLTGDARGDFVLEGLKELGLLKETRPLHLDLLKIPHHGSDKNVDVDFFKKIPADHYVISGNGDYGNPEKETLEMIEEARGTDEYTIHFTFTEDAHRTETTQKRRAVLAEVHEWVQQRPDNCHVVFREKDDEVLSVTVDLLDPLYDE